LRANSTIEQHFIPITPVQLAQTLITVDLTVEGPFDDRFVGLIDYDKWPAVKERLRAIEI